MFWNFPFFISSGFRQKVLDFYLVSIGFLVFSWVPLHGGLCHHLPGRFDKVVIEEILPIVL
jgi:hypothetical protein